MPSEATRLKHQQWTKDNCLITTDSSLIPVPELNAAFASKEVYWTNAVPDEILQETLDNSLCFGLFQVQASQQTPTDADTTVVDATTPAPLQFLGLARCITDYTTFLYLTDVYIHPSQQGNGLGKWLMACVQEVILSMPYLRRSLLFTGDWERSVPFYERLMGMSVMESGRRGGENGGGVGLAVMERRGRGHPLYEGEDKSS